MDFELESRMTELINMRIQITRTQLLLSKMLSEINHEMDEVLKRIEILLRNYDPNCNQANQRRELLRDTIHGASGIEAASKTH